MDIRRYRPDDAGAICRIFFSSVREAGIRDYSHAQVEAWAPAPPDSWAMNQRAGDGRTCLVAVNDRDEPLAYGDLEVDGHIDHLYCAPEFIGTGLASAIYAELEKIARGQGMRRLYTEASEAARQLFEHKGFAIVGRREFQLRGVAIHNYAMEKMLPDR